LKRFLHPFYFPLNHEDPRALLLYRFYLAVIAINLLALIVDYSTQKHQNITVECSAVILLFAGLWFLRRYGHVTWSALWFVFTVSGVLLSLIALNHFATMSVAFVLLLPLTTLLFFPLRVSLLLTLLLIGIMGGLLYLEALHNPHNPIAHNTRALFTLAYSAAIIYLFGLLYHFSILRTFHELDASNRQKAMLLQEVHHRVKNNLNIIASIMGLQEHRLEGRERELLTKNKTRIESIAIVHEMLYRHDDFENIAFKPYMERLSGLLLQMYAETKKITVTIESTQQRLPLEKMVQLGIMANELITNSIKYAFPERENGTIQIGLQKNNGVFCFSYADNGVGVADAEALAQKHSLGIKLIHLTARQLGGEVKIVSRQGLHYYVEFTE